MEDEIKAGEFIRTDDGRIYKLEDLEDEFYSSDKFYNNIVKHSSNLIDLIQYRDYVNGEQITDIWNGNRVSSIKSNFNEEDIKTIVTKEMMESISYKVTKM